MLGKLYARHLPLSAVVQRLVLDCIRFDVTLLCRWIPGVENKWADLISRRPLMEKEFKAMGFDPAKRVRFDVPALLNSAVPGESKWSFDEQVDQLLGSAARRTYQ